MDNTPSGSASKRGPEPAEATAHESPAVMTTSGDAAAATASSRDLLRARVLAELAAESAAERAAEEAAAAAEAAEAEAKAKAAASGPRDAPDSDLAERGVVHGAAQTPRGGDETVEPAHLDSESERASHHEGKDDSSDHGDTHGDGKAAEAAVPGADASRVLLVAAAAADAAFQRAVEGAFADSRPPSGYASTRQSPRGSPPPHPPSPRALARAGADGPASSATAAPEQATQVAAPSPGTAGGASPPPPPVSQFSDTTSDDIGAASLDGESSPPAEPAPVASPETPLVAIDFPDVDGDTLERALMYFAVSKDPHGPYRHGGAPEAFLAGIEPQAALDLLNFGDYLDAPDLVAFAASRLAPEVATQAELERLELPTHLIQALLAHRPQLLAALTPSAAADLGLSLKECWLAAYRATLAAARARTAFNVETFIQHRMYGPSSSRDLTMLPEELQRWYSDLANGETAGFDTHFELLMRLLSFSRQLGVQRKVDASGIASLSAGTRDGRAPESPPAVRPAADGGDAGGGDGASDGGTDGGGAATTVASLGGAHGGGSPLRTGLGRAATARGGLVPGGGARPVLGGTRVDMRRATTMSGHGLRRGAAAGAAAARRYGPVYSHVDDDYSAASSIAGAGAGVGAGAGAAGLGVGAAGSGTAAERERDYLRARQHAVAGTRPGSIGPARVGGGFDVYVSPPSKTPSKYARKGPLKLGGSPAARDLDPVVTPKRHRPSPPKRASGAGTGSVAKAEKRRLRAARRIQAGARVRKAHVAVSNRRLELLYQSGLVPVVVPSVDVFGCGELVNALVPRLCMCTSLRSLDLRGCRSLTPASVLAIANSLPGLQYLDLSGARDCGDAEMAALGRLGRLVTLQVCGWNKKLTSKGVVAFASKLPKNRIAPAVAPMQRADRAPHGIAQRLLVGLEAMEVASLRSRESLSCVCVGACTAVPPLTSCGVCSNPTH